MAFSQPASPATSVNPGSSDCLPITYPSIVLKQMINNLGDRFIPFYSEIPFSPPVYNPIDVRGPSSQYAEDVRNYGLVTITITRSNLNGRYAPAYVEVGANGVTYVIQVGQPVQVPRNVLTIIQDAGAFTATVS
jgi:hypothetical protein